MHICFLTSEFPKKNFPHGGIGTFVYELSLGLIKNGIDVTIVGLNYINKFEYENVNGIKVYRVPKKKIKGYNFIYNFFSINSIISKIHKKNKINIIEGPEMSLALIKKKPDIKYVIRMHGGHHFFSSFENRRKEIPKVIIEKFSFSKADYFVAVSNFVGNKTFSFLGYENHKFNVIYNSINTKTFLPSKKNNVRKHSIFFVGTIVEKKGIRQLIKAIKILKNEYPEINLKIAGKFGKIPGTNRNYKEILLDEIDNSIAKNIQFLGAVPNSEIPNLISSSNICCLPSHMESFGITWIETMSIGKILIAGDVGPAREIIDDMETGILVNPLSSKDIAKKIKWVFENHNHAIEIGKNAQLKITNQFSLRNILSENMKFYNSIK